MDRRHIIPVAAADHGGPVVVVDVRQTGPEPLDVRLVGCEGEHPYVAKIKQRDIKSLKKKGSDEEWHLILSHFLLQKQPEGQKASILDNVSMAYAFQGKNIQITLRRDVQGIKVTLGQLELKREPEEEIDPIDWAYSSAMAHNMALQEIAQLKARLDGEQDALDKLNAQFEDFIRTKEEAEASMLQQFMGLLNEKKRKIRDQSRLLAGATVDNATASAVTSAREETKPRRAGPSRTSKRKTRAKVAAVTEEQDDDQMDLDRETPMPRDDESGNEAATPDRSTGDETADEDGDEKTAPIAPATTAGGQPPQTEPPPRRELPFGRTHRSAKKQPSPPVAEDDGETEDEL